MPAVSVDVVLSWFQTRLGDATLYRPGLPEVSHLSLALEPGDLPADLQGGAIFLHRAHRLGEGFPGLAVLNSHDGFDAALTTGPNLPLAEKLRWHEVQHANLKRASGLIALPPQRDWQRLLAALHAEFGGHEAVLPPHEPEVQRVALMNAMRPELLEAVSKLGVNVYLTGQMRPGALPTARQLGLGVVALGHHRTELWGLRQLAREVSAEFPGLNVQVYPDLGLNGPQT
jgi:putative NIF3 family GTP cyclohydrolase 1 type 2